MSKRLIGLTVAALLSIGTAQARDSAHHFKVDEVLDSAQATEALGEDHIDFYFKGKSHPEVLETYGEGITNKKTNAVNKSDEEACRWVMLGALKALQAQARERGANAVIDIVSYYKKNTYESATEYECHAGFLMSGVALKGTYVKLAE